MTGLVLIVKATVVLGAALAAAWAARRQRASVRYSLLASGFAVLLFLPPAAALSPRLVVEIPLAAVASIPGSTPVVPSPGPGVDSGVAPATPAGSASRTDHVVPLSWLELLRFAWALGVLPSLVPVVAVVQRLRHIRRRGRAWPDGEALARDVAAAGGVRRGVSVLLHEDVAVPMACGLVRPVILMPPDSPTWAEADLRRAFTHEVEHIRRADWPVFVAVRLLCAV